MSQPKIARRNGWGLQDGGHGGETYFPVRGLRRPPSGRERLDRRYGAIGISAVAAAVRYQGASKADAGARDDDDRVSARTAA